jgi:peptide/nickel transport system substrate-binding protein
MNNIAYRHGGAPIWLIGWGNTTWDADNTLTNMFRTGELLANYWNTEFNTLLDDARTITDQKKRQEMYSKAAKIFMEDAPVISLYQQIDNYGVSRKLEWAARSDERIEGYNMAVKQ